MRNIASPAQLCAAGCGLALVISMVGCGAQLRAGTPAPTPAVTITVTARATVAPTEESSEDRTGYLGADAAEKSSGKHTWEADAERWRLVSELLSQSNEKGKPVKARFSAVIRTASYTTNGAWNKHVKLSLDRVEWNPKYTDGANEDPVINPHVKWETINAGDLLVLINPGDGNHQVPIADFPKVVQAEVKQAKDNNNGWLTPFIVYYIGNQPVALVEWYLP
jgi:hypothetical protein